MVDVKRKRSKFLLRKNKGQRYKRYTQLSRILYTLKKKKTTDKKTGF